MAQITLAVKHRPQKFSDLTEQKGIVNILENQLKTKEHKNAYLFTGSAGTGKTTSARIFANEINQGKGNPLELDAASNNSVEDIRRITDQSKFRALDGEYKIYIIDECHMLSNAAWNAMLKVLEEPPKSTIFIFCTTDPQKIPNTILSRVQRYDFQKITPKGISERLKYILKKEKLSGENDAIEYIAKFVDGGMRDAISLMDKCLSLNKKLTLKNVIDVIGAIEYEGLFDFLMLIQKKGEQATVDVLDLLHQIYNSGKDLKFMLKSFIQFILDVIKYKLTQDFDIIKIPEKFEESLNQVKLSRFDLLDLVDSASALQSQIKWDNQPITLLELFFIKWTTENRNDRSK